VEIGADFHVLLKNWLIKQVGPSIGGIVKLNRFFGSEERQAGSKADDWIGIGKARIDECECDAALAAGGEWSVVSRAGRSLGVLVIGVGQTPALAGKGIVAGLEQAAVRKSASLTIS
jgi:hypothetical protein